MTASEGFKKRLRANLADRKKPKRASKPRPPRTYGYESPGPYTVCCYLEDCNGEPVWGGPYRTISGPYATVEEAIAAMPPGKDYVETP